MAVSMGSEHSEMRAARESSSLHALPLQLQNVTLFSRTCELLSSSWLTKTFSIHNNEAAPFRKVVTVVHGVDN